MEHQKKRNDGLARKTKDLLSQATGGGLIIDKILVYHQDHEKSCIIIIIIIIIVIIVSVIIGALGTTPKALPKRLKEIGIDTRIVELQKTVLLQSARILRQVLEI